MLECVPVDVMLPTVMLGFPAARFVAVVALPVREPVTCDTRIESCMDKSIFLFMFMNGLDHLDETLAGFNFFLIALMILIFIDSLVILVLKHLFFWYSTCILCMDDGSGSGSLMSLMFSTLQCIMLMSLVFMRPISSNLDGSARNSS